MYHIDEHADMFTLAERAALALAERMTTDARGVDENVWADLREHFDEGQVIELAAVIGLFNYFNRFNDALQVEITRPAVAPQATDPASGGAGTHEREATAGHDATTERNDA